MECDAIQSLPDVPFLSYATAGALHGRHLAPSSIPLHRETSFIPFKHVEAAEGRMV